MTNTLITISNPRSPVAEAYRTLRTNLEFSALDKPLRTMVATSAGADEGKSTTLANLAVTMAQAGKRVLLVDCDLRRPSLHTIFDLRNNSGVTDLMRDDSLLAHPPFQDTPEANLKVITSGQLPPNPSELLGSRRMGEVIQGLLAYADVILFDTPPIIAVTDAAILSSKVDGVLLVLSAGKTSRDRAKKAQALLDKAHARLVGAVLNNARVDSSMGYYYAESKETGKQGDK
ncbi:MAG: CpsD/CapB family tyrosine-protein kinase [Anaerolineae bacterium]